MTPQRVVDVCGAVSALAYLALAWESRTPPVPLPVFFAIAAIAWLSLLFAFRSLPEERSRFPLRRVLLWAVVFRLIGFAADPVLEDDHYRYLWDGRTFAVEGSPYLRAPEESFEDPLVPARFEAILDRVNHPDLPTLYPPVAQLAFLAGYWTAPGEIRAIKLLLLAADLATLALLLGWAPLRGVLLYAWCPLLIRETAFTGHVDSLGVFFLIAAASLRWSGRSWPKSITRREAMIGILAALAVATKPFALLIVPLLAVRSKPALPAAFAATLAILYLPFLAISTAMFAAATGGAGLQAYSESWEFNSTLYAVIANSAGTNTARIALLLAISSVCAALCWRESVRDDLRSKAAHWPRGDWLFACLFLFAPVVNPWYLIWMLPFVAMRPSGWGVAALAMVSLSYAHGLFLSDGLAAYEHPVWVRPLEIAGIGLAALLAWMARRSTRSSDDSSHLPASLPTA